MAIISAVDQQVKTRSSRRRREAMVGILFMLPAAIVFLIVIFGPMIWGISLGFYKVEPLTLQTRFIRLQNFDNILGSGQFLKSLVISLKYTLGTLVLETVIGVLVAVLLHKQFAGRAIARSLIVFPYLLPAVVSVAVWKWMFNDTFGIVNHLMISGGLIDRPIAWISSPNNALLSVIIVSAWRTFPFVVIATLGRLQNIPAQLYEAAKIDGASSRAMFWDITLPQLKSVLVVTIFLRFIWNFNDFNTIAIMTGGGPVERTMTLPILIYQFGFARQDLGSGAAVANLSMIALTVFFLIYFWLAKPLGTEKP